MKRVRGLIAKAAHDADSYNNKKNYDVRAHIGFIDKLIEKHKVYEYLGKLHCNAQEELIEDIKDLDHKICSNERDVWVNIYFSKPYMGVCQIALKENRE